MNRVSDIHNEKDNNKHYHALQSYTEIKSSSPTYYSYCTSWQEPKLLIHYWWVVHWLVIVVLRDGSDDDYLILQCCSLDCCSCSTSSFRPPKTLPLVEMGRFANSRFDEYQIKQNDFNMQNFWLKHKIPMQISLHIHLY